MVQPTSESDCDCVEGSSRVQYATELVFIRLSVSDGAMEPLRCRSCYTTVMLSWEPSDFLMVTV